MATFKRLLIEHPKTRPFLRGTGNYALRQMRGVVIHWTANLKKGANAVANRNYFNNGAPGEGGVLRAASAHYIVDDRTVVQCLPENEVGFHCADKPLGQYKPAGIQLMTGYISLTPNYFTIGIEMCVNSDGNWDLTYEHTVALTAELLVKYNLSAADHLHRHFDITGKGCPKPFLPETEWAAFKLNVAMRMEVYDMLGVLVADATDDLFVHSGPGVQYAVQYSLDAGERVMIYSQKNEWMQIGNGFWLNGKLLRNIRTLKNLREAIQQAANKL